MMEGGATTATARLLERERMLAALEQGNDVLAEAVELREQSALLSGPLQYDPARVGLAIVPETSHPLCESAQAQARVPSALVSPEMTDDERRSLGIALRNRTVQLLLVTPERLAQPKFVQFIRSQSPCYVAVVSCQRLSEESPDYFPPYESLRALRALFPGIPLLALSDGRPQPSILGPVAAALGLAVPRSAEVAVATPVTPRQTADEKDEKDEPEDGGSPEPLAGPTEPPATTEPEPQTHDTNAENTEQEQSTSAAVPDAPSAPVYRPPAPTPETKPVVRRPVRRIPPPEGAQDAFPLFADETPLADVAEQLDKDEDWVYAALAAYIRESGRSNPFPWIDKPSYLVISMAAGQAETTDPRLIASVLGDGVDARLIAPVLAALDNRQGGGARLG